MLPNNNQAVISRLAANGVKHEKGKFAILLFSVILASFLLFSVFTAGEAWFKLSRLQNTRLYGAEYDIVLANGFTREQREFLLDNDRVESVGIQTYAGYVRSTNLDETADTGLLWCDEAFWENQQLPARTEFRGHYPEKYNELLVTENALERCGLKGYDIGDSFAMTYEDNRGIHSGDFVISGIWDGFGDTSPIYVSKAFYEKTGYDLSAQGSLCIKLSSNFVLPQTMDEIEAGLHLSDRQSFQPMGYIENSWKVLLGIIGLCLIICLSAYLLIYNILYLSVAGRVRYYGLLQALGMTKKQLKAYVSRQMKWIAVIGTGTGILLGAAGIWIFIPRVLSALGITTENIQFSFSPTVLFITVCASSAAVLCGVKTPLSMACRVTPQEACGYQPEKDEVGKARNVRKEEKRIRPQRNSVYFSLAWKQLGKSRKRSAVVFLSLAISLSVFYGMTTIIQSQGERTVADNYLDSDLTVRNDTTTEKMDSLKSVFTKKTVQTIDSMKGVEKVNIMEGLPVTIPSEGFMQKYIREYTDYVPYTSYEEEWKKYAAEPDTWYSMLKGIDEEEFAYLNSSLGDVVNTEEFMDGKTAVMLYPGFTLPEETWRNEPVEIEAAGKRIELTISAVSYEPYYGGTRNMGPTLIVSSSLLRELSSEPVILGLNICYAERFDEGTEENIMALLSDSPYFDDFYIDSKLENMESVQASQKEMMQVGIAISLLLLFVGLLNYINTMTCNIQNRRLSIAIMESLGMSRKQTRKLLMREGLLYGAGAILITATAGTAVTYGCFQAMNYMGAPFKLPFMWLAAALILVLTVCAVLPMFIHARMIKGKSLVERLREFE